MALDPEEKVAVIRRALALYFDCDEKEIGNFVLGVERDIGGSAMFSGGWSVIPHWYLIGLADELSVMLRKQRDKPQEDNGLDRLLRVEQ